MQYGTVILVSLETGGSTDYYILWYKYGHEMLSLRWHLSNDVSTPELQRAILAAMLAKVNGKINGFRGTDWILEVVNGAVLRDMAIFKNSTHEPLSVSRFVLRIWREPALLSKCLSVSVKTVNTATSLQSQI